MKSQLPQKHSGFVGDSGSTRLAKADGRGRWEPIFQIRSRESQAQWAGAGHQPTLKKGSEGWNFHLALLLAACKWLQPWDQMVKETVLERMGPIPCTATSGLPHQECRGRRAWRVHYTQHTGYVYGSPSSTIWQLTPIFLVPYSIVAVYSDSRERIKHYALDKLHPFAKCFPHLSPNKNILNDYTEPKRCWSLPSLASFKEQIIQMLKKTVVLLIFYLHSWILRNFIHLYI